MIKDAYLLSVAPCVGAWIETSRWVAVRRVTMSRPAWARGLKLDKKGNAYRKRRRALRGRVD